MTDARGRPGGRAYARDQRMRTRLVERPRAISAGYRRSCRTKTDNESAAGMTSRPLRPGGYLGGGIRVQRLLPRLGIGALEGVARPQFVLRRLAQMRGRPAQGMPGANVGL